MFQSIIIYTFIIVVMLIFAWFASRKTVYTQLNGMIIQCCPFWSFEMIFPLVFFAIMFGMRYDVGTDSLGYLDYYNTGIKESKFELLFTLLTQICWFFKFNSVVFFSIIAFIQVFFFFYAFKKEIYLFPFLVLFLFTNGDWMFWMNGIRQALAMCIWIYSINFIVEKKLWRYLIFGVIAYLFHRSAIILFIFYPILRNGKDYFKNIPLQLILLIIAFIIKKLFYNVIINLSSVVTFYQTFLGGEENLYNSYDINTVITDMKFSNNNGTNTGIAYIWRIVVNVVIILYSLKLKKYYNSKKFNIIYFFFFIGLLLQYVFPNGAIVLTRPFRYFYIFQAIMLAYLAYYLFKINNIKNKIFFYVLIVSFLGIFYLNQIVSNENSHLWYQFFFQEHVYRI